MNERSQMMNQAIKVIKHKQPMAQMMSQPMPQLMNQRQPQMLNQLPQKMSQATIMNKGYNRMWPQPPQPMNPAMEQRMAFQNPFNVGKPPGLGRSNWKGKKGMNNQNDMMIRRNEPQQVPHMSNQVFTNVGGGGGYQPPALLELQSQNRNKARKYYHTKKKFSNRFAPYAPRNTSSFIIRAKKSGGIASLVSPCPVTPAVLPTPVFSPSREVLGDIAKEEWGVDGYGSMKGLIRLRSPGSDGDEDEDGSSESDVEEHVEVERRLDHDLSRFEMVYPNGAGSEYNNLLENRVDDQDTHLAQLEEENLTLKERLFLMEREMRDLRKRLQSLERLTCGPGYGAEEVVENGSDNDAESNGRGEDRQLRVGYNEELENVDNHQRDDHGYQKEDIKAVAQDVLENENGLNPNDDVGLHCEEIEKKVENDIKMEEYIAPSEHSSADEVSRAANEKYLCDSKIMEQTIDDGDIKEQVIGGVNVIKGNVLGAENPEEHNG